MPTVIKAGDYRRGRQAVVFNLEDLRRQAETCLATIRDEARQILLAATRDAQGIRQAAEAEGRRAAQADHERLLDIELGRRLETALPALRAAIAEVCDSKQQWLACWQKQAVHLAAAIAGRICRRELAKQPEISIELVREALELSAGAGQVRVLLNPDDHAAWGGRVREVVSEMARLGPAEVVADRRIGRGGCRVETSHGAIDEQIETQLARIVEELT